MKPFDPAYQVLADMYQDAYFPHFLVDKLKALIWNVIEFLQTEERDLAAIQKKLDDMTLGMNALQAEFEAHDSELETAARESIGDTIAYILKWFKIEIDVEDALGKREW